MKNKINIALILIILICGGILVMTIKNDLKSPKNDLKPPIVTEKQVALSTENVLDIVSIYQENGFEFIIDEKIENNKYTVTKQNIETKKIQMTFEVDIFTGEMSVKNVNYSIVGVVSH